MAKPVLNHPTPLTIGGIDPLAAADPQRFAALRFGHGQIGVYGPDPNALKVTAQAAPNMTVQIATGGAGRIGGSRFDMAAITAIPQVGTIATNSGDYDRYDVVYIDSQGRPGIAAGNSTGIPVFGVAPANTIPLARVKVRTGAASIVSTDIEDLRVMLTWSLDTYDIRSPRGRELLVWRVAFAGALAGVKSANICAPADSMFEGGTTALTPAQRPLSLLRQGLQQAYRPGGRGFVPAQHVAPLPNEWTVIGAPNLTDFGFGLGRLGVAMTAAAQTQSMSITDVFDQVWIHYSQGSGAGNLKIAIDPVVTTLSGTGTIGAGTGTGTYIFTSAALLPAGAFNVMIGGEILTGSLSGTTFTVTARAVAPGAVAVAHAVGDAVWYSPYGVNRVDAFRAANGQSGRVWNSGKIPGGLKASHTVLVAADNTGTLASFAAFFDGATFFSGDGGDPAAFEDGQGVSGAKGYASLSATPMASDVGKTIVGENVAAATTIASVPTPVTALSFAAGTLTCNVSTASYAAAGAIRLPTTQGGQTWPEIITYTGISGSTFTGCSTPVGTIIVGQPVTQWVLSANANATGAGKYFTIKRRVVGNGIHMFPSAHGGYQASAFGLASSPNYVWAQSLDAFYPELLLIEFGINDRTAGRDIPSFKTDLVGIVTNAVAQGNGKSGGLGYTPSVVLVPLWGTSQTAAVSFGDGVTNGTNQITSATAIFRAADVGLGISAATNIPGGTTITAVAADGKSATMSATATANAALTFTIAGRLALDVDWVPYRQAMYDVAKANGYDVWDMYNAFGYIGTDPNGLTDGALVHPSPPGSEGIANELCIRLSGQGLLPGFVPTGIANNAGELAVVTADNVFDVLAAPAVDGQALVADLTQTKKLNYIGGARVIASIPSDTTVVNTVTETTLGTLQTPANPPFAVGDVLDFHWGGNGINNSGIANTAIYGMRVGAAASGNGGTLIGSNAGNTVSHAAGANRRTWDFSGEIEIEAVGASGIIRVSGKLIIADTAATDRLIKQTVAGNVLTIENRITGVDFTSAKDFNFLVKFGAAALTVDHICQVATLKLVKK